MASDPDKPLLRLRPQDVRDRPAGRQRKIQRPEPFSQARQTDRFSPKFRRLAEVLDRDPSGLELRADPSALAPERLLVFEVRGALNLFANAVRQVPGLELVDEEELAADDSDKAPVAYLMVPDTHALRELESLWRRWQRGQLVVGETPWRDVFSLLRDLRPWGPQDRVQPTESSILEEEVLDCAPDDLIRLEIELVYRAAEEIVVGRVEEVDHAIQAQGGRVISKCRVNDIAYDAILADLPAAAVRRIIERTPESIAGLDAVMHIRPQAIASGIEVEEIEEGAAEALVGALGEPILPLIDGVPIAAHRLLADHLVLDDRFDLEPLTPVADRIHGTAMASLIVHGDRNRGEPALPRRIHVVPVLGPRDAFAPDRLVVDMIYTAVVAMREGTEASAPGVLIINVSLGNPRRPFHGQLSAWARLLDRLAYRFGILFIVSAGNCLDPFAIEAFASSVVFEDADPVIRAEETLRSLGSVVADRRLFSPAETVNGLTIGAWNDDAVSMSDRATARVNVDPYGTRRMTNPSSALGPGFALSVKPDVLLPGARERLRVIRSHTHIEVRPVGPMRAAGLRVASPPRDGRENQDGYTNGTSAAAALSSRTAHRIHDALEAAYGLEFLSMPNLYRAVLLKALLAHTAKWPEETAALIRRIIGPADGRQHVRQKDNIRRFLGFGIVEPDDAVACAADRATFWATGLLARDKVSVINVPVPIAMGGQARPHSLSTTLAWFTPTSPGRKSYRSVRLRILEPSGLDALRITPNREQPDSNQTNRGTLFMRCWAGDQAPVVTADMIIPLSVQRDPDQGATVDEQIPFGLAVTLTMPGVLQIYDQIRARLGVGVRPSA